MKLKKLILAGFKSFAKKTEFEFDDGVSCIVGPNGCGKSNIVDAVKWVLGERSAKSLRGEEMMDVIFNGSAARSPGGVAEVTLIFENDRGLLKPDLAGGKSSNGVVSVGRRLYRSGQSEYLINNTSCRLKDVRELFMDTGVGVEAYSLIEQGKVEIFLQATQDERRGIFDEAAGISKYKARKRETLRRLERVEQNMLRLSDILAEVEKRLRSIKYQAGKARSHQAHTQRLKELRSLYFLAQYHILSQQRARLQRDVDQGNDLLASADVMIDKLESARSAADIEALDLERAGRELEAKIAAVSAQITTCEERIEMLTARVGELGEKILASSARCEQLEAKAAERDEEIISRLQQIEEVEGRIAALAEEHGSAQGRHLAGRQAIEDLRNRLEESRASAVELMQQAARIDNEIGAVSVRREDLEARKGRLERRSAEIGESLGETAERKAQTQGRLAGIEESIAATEAQLGRAKSEAGRIEEGRRELLARIADCREKRSALESRISLLGEMLARLEGVGGGTRRVLEAHRQGRLRPILGMLADFIETDFEHAQVVEAAIAGCDELLLATGGDVAAVGKELSEILNGSGSVEVLCLDADLPPMTGDHDGRTCPRLAGRAIDYMRFPAGVAPVIWRLLGRTFVAETVADALAAARALRDCRFVTRAGEVLEADGRVRLGCAGRSAGVVARRSELAELQGQAGSLAAEIKQLDDRRLSTKGEMERIDALQQGLRTAVYEATTERVEVEGLLKALDSQAADLQKEQQVVAADMKAAAEEIEGTLQAQRRAEENAAQTEQQKLRCEQAAAAVEEEMACAAGAQESLAARMTEVRVAQAAAEEKKTALRDAVSALRAQQEQVRRDIEASRAEIQSDRRRREESEAAIVKAREEMERLYAEQQRLTVESEDAEESRKGLQERLEEIRHTLSERRKEQQQAAQRVNARRVELGEADVRVEDLIARAADEMDMNLTELYGAYEHDENRDWNAVKTEIQELNEKIRRLGNVNLDAIGEQEELEQRREFLTKQLDDVKSSRNQLNDLIRRINKESRQRFMETFEATRTNFHELFRKLFGGGRADIILLDPEDVLESGIEIVARPPGKELRSLSLLSGGEKTMTALALLFSIFKSRPSPFCLLDEVDAALDEANTERFGQLLQEFVADSQFIIISHAKRTMSMASVLYGVTMQEAGVSTRISVRFEDVGHKLDEQLEPVGA